MMASFLGFGWGHGRVAPPPPGSATEPSSLRDAVLCGAASVICGAVSQPAEAATHCSRDAGAGGRGVMGTICTRTWKLMLYVGMCPKHTSVVDRQV